MKTDRHLWRTDDGRLVHTGDPDARILAYPAGSDVAKADEKLLDGSKSRPASANKMRKPASNKGA